MIFSKIYQRFLIISLWVSFAWMIGASNALASFDVIHEFAVPGMNPAAPVIKGSDGFFYGTTGNGGSYGAGTIFKIAADGTGLIILHNFNDSDGFLPYSELTQGSDGFLYGTTYYGGSYGQGTIFKIAADGTGFNTLHNFNRGDGSDPIAGLTWGSDGFLYGTTGFGGSYGQGTIFKIASDGMGFISLHSFNRNIEGAYPYSEVIQGSDGLLYGTTLHGGSNGKGTIFKIALDGTGFTTLHNFNGSDGDSPFAPLTLGSDGFFYGAAGGGSNNQGTIFKIAPDGTGFTTLHNFNGNDGTNPFAPLTLGDDGFFYGTTESGGGSSRGTIFKIAMNGTGFTTLHSFNGDDGSSPDSRLTQGNDGFLYSTTSSGGGGAYGTVFKIALDGTGFSMLHSFSTGDGYYLGAGLTQGSDGFFYGTTENGGDYGAGTIFKIAADGTGYTTLHSFNRISGSCEFMGCNSRVRLTQGSDGFFYGTTEIGGDYGAGTIFKIAADGTGYVMLHSFDGSDGSSPIELTQGSDGFFYGTAQSGGSNYSGTIFKIAADGAGFTTLYNFNESDGFYPYAGLTQGSDGFLYGTTSYGGSNYYGTIFKIAADGTGFAALYNFNGNDGSYPRAGLTQDSNGFLYSTTSYGGSNYYGTIFKIAEDGTGFAALYNFNGNDGSFPSAGLMLGNDGFLYGTAQAASSNYYATIFKIAVDGTGFAILHNFNEDSSLYSTAGLTQGGDGAIYGTTRSGGTKGGGTIYRLTEKIPQTITFETLASKVYGDPSFQVSATASSNLPVSFSASGNCTISGDLVTISGAGFCTITAMQGGDNNYYPAASVSQSFAIAKATPVITWATPADITYGTALSATQLNASANVAGSFSYTPAAGTVLNASAGQTLSVQFTPGNSTNYKTATASVLINVQQATPVITWATPADITYGTPLSSTQLNASANVAGSFSYTPAAGTVLDAGSGQTLSVQFTPSNSTNYKTASASVLINVQQATPVITWATPADITYGTALSATQLNASANVAGSFSYTPVAGTVLNLGSGQTLSVQFTPSDSINYTAASGSVTINVLYAFTGFSSPVVNPPAFNSVKAGNVVPVYFSLGGNQGLNIFAAGYPVSASIACDSSATINVVKSTTTSSSLTYSSKTGLYNYPWSTGRTWAGTCRRLTMKLIDGSVHYADFLFTVK